MQGLTVKSRVKKKSRRASGRRDVVFTGLLFEQTSEILKAALFQIPIYGYYLNNNTNMGHNRSAFMILAQQTSKFQGEQQKPR